MTNYTIDTSYLDSFNNSVSFPYKDLPQECLIEGTRYSADCLNKWFCPQMPEHMVKIGLGLIIGYVVSSYLLWFMMTRGYKYLPKYWQDYNKRVYWLDWIKTRILTLFLGYVIITVWWYW